MKEAPERTWDILVERAGELHARRYLRWLETVYITETILRQMALPPAMRLGRAIRLLVQLSEEMDKAA